MSRILAGPWAGQLLANLGAEVIKVERPGTGDDTRAWGPPFLRDQAGNETSEPAYFLCANRGKKSITLDIARPEGQQIAGELGRASDVLIENYKVGDLTRYGLDYGTLSALNPIKFSRTPLSYHTPPPLLGQHTDEILGELLGKDERDIAALRSKGII